MVDQGRVVTSGGATSFLNLALYLIERVLGAEVARAASRMFLIDLNKAPQSAYAIFATQRAHGDEEVLRAQGIIESEFARALTVDELARQVTMSGRNFVRRFKRATGNAPPGVPRARAGRGRQARARADAAPDRCHRGRCRLRGRGRVSPAIRPLDGSHAIGVPGSPPSGALTS